MSDTIIVALLSLGGTLFGSLAGIVASGKLTAFRLSMLEKKVDLFGEIMQKIPLMEKEQKDLSLRVLSLEKITSKSIYPS